MMQLLELFEQVAHLFSQFKQFCEEKSSNLEEGQAHSGGVILSPLHIRQFEF
jgi:hypothetical protein